MISDPHKIVWLASYPKSGNTWFRIFLSNLLANSETPVNINELEGGAIASNRQLFDEATGLSSSDLTPQEIENLRPEVYRYIAAQSENLLFHKIHDAYILTSQNVPLIPADATRCVIYFIRNPLDVAVSFAHHANLPINKIVEQMCDNTFAFCNHTNKLHNQLNQLLLSWSNHVISWVDRSGLPIKVIRYEDMKTKPFDTFRSAIDFIGLEYTDAQIDKAIRFSDFSVVKEQEDKIGFKEKAQISDRFFRKGIVGSWKTELKPEEIENLINHNKEIMHRFEYL